MAPSDSAPTGCGWWRQVHRPIALFLGPVRWAPRALAAKGRQKAAPAQALKQPGGDAQLAQAVDAAVSQARKLIDAGKHEEASRLLVRVRKGLGEERDPRVEGLLARAALALKQPKVALELAEPFAENRDAYDPALTDCYLAAGNAYLATDQPYKALLIFDWMAGQAKGLDLILAAEGCGRALLARKEFQKAAASFRFALRYARRGYDYPEEIKDLIRRLEAQLAKAERLAVPEKARKVTAPPRREKSVDFWGNVKKNAIEPGQLVNRKTCPWYLDDLAEQCAMYLGFLAFVDGNQDEALAYYKRILDCDPATRRLDTEGVWNDYSRLKWGAEHGYLYAYPGELAAFKDSRQRLGAMLADFYYVTQRWEEARHMARRLLKSEAGPLPSAAREYAQYVYAAAVYRTAGRDKAVPQYLKVVKHGGGRLKTFTQPRAAYAAANLARGSSKKEVRDLARDLLVRLVRSPNPSMQSHKARIVLAQDLIREKHTAEGLALLRSMPASAGDYKALADYYLKKYANPGLSD